MSTSEDLVYDQSASVHCIPIDDGLQRTGYRKKVFSLNRWLSCRSMGELVAIAKHCHVSAPRLSRWEKETLRSLMAVSGYQTEIEQRKAELRCLKRLSLAAAVEICFRRDWLQIVSPMTLRKDPRLCIKRTEMGRIMASVMAGSPLVEPIKK